MRVHIGSDHAGLELDPLTAFVTWLVELAECLAALPAQVPIPAAMRQHADAWTQAARQLGGRLHTAEPRIDVERDVLGQMGFRPRVAEQLATMDARLYATGPMGLAADFGSRS